MSGGAVLLIASCLLVSGCRKDIQPGPVQLFDAAKPILTIGGDIDNPNVRAYKWIQHYTVDYSGNIFIANDSEFTIDKYDPQGRFLSAVGRKGQGPGEFDGGSVPGFAMNSRGSIYTSSLRSKLVVLNPDGALNKEVDFPLEARGSHVGLIRIDPADNVHAVFYGPESGVLLARFSSDLMTYYIYHRAVAREGKALGILRFLPDLDFDRNGNVYVTDGYDFRVHIYSSEGKPVRVFEKDFRKNRIVPGDLVLFSGRGQELADFSKDPNALNILRGLSEKDSYLPSIFGINVFEDGIFVWTSNRDAEFKNVIEIYDREFRTLARSSAYNSIGRNFAVVRGERLYLPNLGSDDMVFKKKLGRLSSFDVPSTLPIYKLNNLTR